MQLVDSNAVRGDTAELISAVTDPKQPVNGLFSFTCRSNGTNPIFGPSLA
jgi:hypothetical protein